MTKEQIEQINRERLEQWATRFADEHATPVILVGIGHDHKAGSIVIETTEEMSDELVASFLRKALMLL